MTNNLKKRLYQHQSGKSKTTNPYRPLKLVYMEQFPSRQKARDREKYLKSGCGKEWIKDHLSQLEP